MDHVLTLVPVCWLVWMGAHSLGAGGPWTWTPWAAGEGGWTSRVNALLSATKAAVGSETGHDDNDDIDDDCTADQNDDNNDYSGGWDSLFCVCCWTAESSPSAERLAAVGSGCCWGTETLTCRGDGLLWSGVLTWGWETDNCTWGAEAWTWGRGWETDDWICTGFWANKACETWSWWGTWYWTWGSMGGWGTELSGPGRTFWAPAGGEKLVGGGVSASWRGGEEQISGVSSGSEWSGEASTHWSDITVWVSWPETARVCGWVSLSLGTGEASVSIGTTGSAPTNSSDVMGELSACCGGNEEQRRWTTTTSLVDPFERKTVPRSCFSVPLHRFIFSTALLSPLLNLGQLTALLHCSLI